MEVTIQHENNRKTTLKDFHTINKHIDKNFSDNLILVYKEDPQKEGSDYELYRNANIKQVKK